MKPRYTLTEVFKIIDSGDINQIWFSAPSRSYRVVVRIYERSQSPKNPDQAMAFVLAGIKELTDRHFVKTVLQWGKPADVYGLIYDGKPWYVKFTLEDDGTLQEISFHPPELEMITIGGIKVPAGELSYEK